jgi:hypothetical protein
MNNTQNIFSQPGERQPVVRTQFNTASINENGVPTRVIDSAQSNSAGCFIEVRPERHDVAAGKSAQSQCENLLFLLFPTSIPQTQAPIAQ